ncbi:hypothetical protein [Nocardioides houyundeii]|uniref:hypothetical protein n=1 Tax=Nocardioides houyundeii TaxID=2045452 RepID=UPI000C78B354|nr:hypothetical protein [Nocardioides houyundeii]
MERQHADRWILSGAALCVALAVTLGVIGDRADDGGGTVPDPAPWAGQQSSHESVDRVLAALGADRVYAMVGEDVMRADLGVVADGRVAPPELRGRGLRLLSNLSGNGKDVVLAGAATSSDDAGFATDSSYRLVDGKSLVPLPVAPRRLFAPTVAADGAIFAIAAERGFWRLPPRAERWQRDPRLLREDIGPVAAAPSGQLFTVTRPASRAARLVRLSGSRGIRRLGPIHCSYGVVPAPSGELLLTQSSSLERVRRNPGCDWSYVVDLRGRDRVTVPAGWDALAWSADSSALLVTREREIAVWTLEGEFLASADADTRLFAATPVYADR